ncbi:hypothetical protein [Nocardioides sp.]|uniref:hypothetical protein n=1 Tax=Nocardioides sp. TaxID=35761 RepID=UPI002C66AFE9|nr:hypothetical protein [Nocardioides sp.]HXH77183.1 hypothetical protein [Nocardioides sp.]
MDRSDPAIRSSEQQDVQRSAPESRPLEIVVGYVRADTRNRPHELPETTLSSLDSWREWWMDEWPRPNQQGEGTAHPGILVVALSCDLLDRNAHIEARAGRYPASGVHARAATDELSAAYGTYAGAKKFWDGPSLWSTSRVHADGLTCACRVGVGPLDANVIGTAAVREAFLALAQEIIARLDGTLKAPRMSLPAITSLSSMEHLFPVGSGFGLDDVSGLLQRASSRPGDTDSSRSAPVGEVVAEPERPTRKGSTGESEADPQVETLRAVRVAKHVRELADIDARRAVVAAAKAGLSQRTIAQELGRSQPDVGRTLKKAAERPGTLEIGPREIAMRRHVGQMSDRVMMNALLRFDYTEGASDPSLAGSGYVRGSWDELRMLLPEHLITAEEWRELFGKIRGVDTAAELSGTGATAQHTQRAGNQGTLS